jgi:hypothetical protein
VGSWINGDAWTGECATVWVPVSAPLRVCVTGYQRHPGCGLWAEFRYADGRIDREACTLADARETWVPWDIVPPKGAIAMRLVAQDLAADNSGWLAFSEPTLVPAQAGGAIYMAAQIFTTLALALTLIWGPGILWAGRGASQESRMTGVFGMGPLILAGLGIVIWAAPPVLRADSLGVILVAMLWIAIGVSLWRRSNGDDRLINEISRPLALSALLALACVAKVSFSGGPEGELYGGSIFRTLAVGDRPDARIPFHVVQIGAHRLGPASPKAENYFAPWTFFSRGPLAGLVALPVTLATAGMPEADTQPRAWQPFDTTGVAAYRIAMIGLASTTIFAFFAAMAPLVGKDWAGLGAGVLSLTPFCVHETFFTWPKLVATGWILASFLLAHHRKPFRAGLALSVGYLLHPMAALWAPWLGLWVMGRRGKAWRSAFGAAVLFVLGFWILTGPWLLAGRLAPHLPASWRAGQGSFFDYFRIAEFQVHPPVAKWIQSRWANFSNTFIPFWLYACNKDHPVLNSIYGPSGNLVKFAFGWWATLPLGAGILLWATALFSIGRAMKKRWAAVALFLVGPALLLTAYWGASSTGLMRECGHPLLVGLVGLGIVGAAAHPQAWEARLLAHRWFPWLQLPGMFLMLWLTTAMNPAPSGADYAVLNPMYVIVNVGALVGISVLIGRRGSGSEGVAAGAAAHEWARSAA